MKTSAQVPGTLRDAVRLWKAAGGKEQPPSRWSPSLWQQQFPEHADYLSTLPQPIGRADVAARCVHAPEGADQATKAFITAMIWGYGTVGYGWFRTSRVLRENEDAGERLATVARIARDQGGPAAFAWLAERPHRLRWLGVAFATKYLFFCAAGGHAQPALVLDRLVRDWMSRNLAWDLRLEWVVEDYHEYVNTMSAWAMELDLKPGDLEMLVFQLAANADPRSLWSAPELFASTHAEASTPIRNGLSDDAVALLEMLEDAATAFASLPDPSDPDDITDFDRGVRDLKRIILSGRLTSRHLDPPMA
jgi:hypothetical protein